MTDQEQKLEECFRRIREHLQHAREKHPDYEYGLRDALLFLSEEHGEVIAEFTKHERGWEDRLHEELCDYIAVALRIMLSDYARQEWNTII